MNDVTVKSVDSVKNVDNARQILGLYIPVPISQQWGGQARAEVLKAVTGLLAAGWLPMSLGLPHRLGMAVDETQNAKEVLRDVWSRITDIQGQQLPETDLSSTVADNANPWGVPMEEPVRYGSCGRGDCTGGGNTVGAGSGMWRRRIDPDTGRAKELCNTAVPGRDELRVPCHPDARNLIARQLPAPRQWTPHSREPANAPQGWGEEAPHPENYLEGVDVMATGFCLACADEGVTVPGLAVNGGRCATHINSTQDNAL